MYIYPLCRAPPGNNLTCQQFPFMNKLLYKMQGKTALFSSTTHPAHITILRQAARNSKAQEENRLCALDSAFARLD